MTDISYQPMLKTLECRKFEHWKQHVNDHFPDLRIEASDLRDFRSNLTHHQFGRIKFTYIHTSALTIERTLDMADPLETGYIKVLWQLGGDLELEQNRKRFLLRQGDISICDTSQRYRLHAGPESRHAVLMLPHDLDSRLRYAAAEHCATELTKNSAFRTGLCAIIGLLNQANAWTAQDVNAVIDTVSDLLVQTLVDQHESDRCGRNHIEAARRYIESHLATTRLSPDDLARALNLSQRSLYNTLARHGTTPARMINEIRLDHAKTRLKTANTDERVIDIAYASGFKDSAQFSRAFKQRFGESPSYWRARSN